VGGLERLILMRYRQRTLMQALPFRHRIWGIHIKVEISNDVEVVPKLLLEVVLKVHCRIESLHDLDYGSGLLVTLGPVLNGLEIVHHLLDISAILRDMECHSLGII
jgi:hypothetical protein